MFCKTSSLSSCFSRSHPFFGVRQIFNAANSRQGVTRPIWRKLCLHHKTAALTIVFGRHISGFREFFLWQQFFKESSQCLGDFSSCCFNVCLIEDLERIKEIDAMLITICFHLQEVTEKNLGKFPKQKTSPLSGFESFDTDAHEWKIKKSRQFLCHSRIAFVVTTKKIAREKKERKDETRKKRDKHAHGKRRKLQKDPFYVLSCIVLQLQHHFMFLFGYCLVA